MQSDKNDNGNIDLRRAACALSSPEDHCKEANGPGPYWSVICELNTSSIVSISNRNFQIEKVCIEDGAIRFGHVQIASCSSHTCTRGHKNATRIRLQPIRLQI